MQSGYKKMNLTITKTRLFKFPFKTFNKFQKNFEVPSKTQKYLKLSSLSNEIYSNHFPSSPRIFLIIQLNNPIIIFCLRK